MHIRLQTDTVRNELRITAEQSQELPQDFDGNHNSCKKNKQKQKQAVNTETVKVLMLVCVGGFSKLALKQF